MKRKYPKHDDCHGVVYKLTSPSGKIYIGQTIKLTSRLLSHKREARKGSHCWIHQAIAKYKLDSFQIEIIAKAQSAVELNELEIQFIQDLDARNPKVGYNSSLGGAQSPEIRKQVAERRRGYKHAEETKLKQARAACERWSNLEAREEHSKLCSGIPKTEEAKSAMRKPHRKSDKLKKPKSELHRRHLSEARKCFYAKQAAAKPAE